MKSTPAVAVTLTAAASTPRPIFSMQKISPSEGGRAGCFKTHALRRDGREGDGRGLCERSYSPGSHSAVERLE